MVCWVRSFQVTAKGFAQYELFKSTALDETIGTSHTTIILDISWSPVDEILQSPPLSSAATLVGGALPLTAGPEGPQGACACLWLLLWASWPGSCLEAEQL